MEQISISVEAVADAIRQVHRYHFITGLTATAEHRFTIHTEGGDYNFHVENGEAVKI